MVKRYLLRTKKKKKWVKYLREIYFSCHEENLKYSIINPQMKRKWFSFCYFVVKLGGKKKEKEKKVSRILFS
jgi:hypothetical protein